MLHCFYHVTLFTVSFSLKNMNLKIFVILLQKKNINIEKKKRYNIRTLCHTGSYGFINLLS